MQIAPPKLIDLVLAAARDVAVLKWRPNPEFLGIQPRNKTIDVRDLGCGVFVRQAHRFPTSSSRNSANLARAAS